MLNNLLLRDRNSLLSRNLLLQLPNGRRQTHFHRETSPSDLVHSQGELLCPALLPYEVHGGGSAQAAVCHCLGVSQLAACVDDDLLACGDLLCSSDLCLDQTNCCSLLAHHSCAPCAHNLYGEIERLRGRFWCSSLNSQRCCGCVFHRLRSHWLLLWRCCPVLCTQHHTVMP